MRIAMWSGPRNLSTAMMYAFGNRADFSVIDEPFYAAYLALTDLDHPMRDQILSSQPTDPKLVETGLSGPVPEGRDHYYQKHMTQHMVPGIPRGWMADVAHVFLLRHPARVVASFAAKYEAITFEDIGFEQQVELYDQVCELGQKPLVVDSFDIRQNPENILQTLCENLGLMWDPNMLNWPSGGHQSDGVWAAHWYESVHRSTGFAGPEGALPALDPSGQALVEAAMPFYERLRGERIY